MKKKLFISCPMKGRTEEDIRKSMEKMHKIAEIIFEQELEVIPTYIEDNPPECREQRLWYLGKSIQMMADADYYIGVRYCGFNGCEIENTAARYYEVKATYVDVENVLPNVVERRLKEALAPAPVNTGE